MSDTTDPTTASGPVLAADGTPLKRSLARSLRMQKTRALLLIAPLLAFVLISFVTPIGQMLYRSVENDIVADTLPLTVAELKSWDATSDELPSEAVYEAFTRDMLVAVEAKNHTRLGSRLNYEKTGMSSLFRRSGRQIEKLNIETDGPFKEALIDIDKTGVRSKLGPRSKRIQGAPQAAISSMPLICRKRLKGLHGNQKANRFC